MCVIFFPLIRRGKKNVVCCDSRAALHADTNRKKHTRTHRYIYRERERKRNMERRPPPSDDNTGGGKAFNNNNNEDNSNDGGNNENNNNNNNNNNGETVEVFGGDVWSSGAVLALVLAWMFKAATERCTC